MKLLKAFYTRSDVVQISQELLGKYLYTHLDGQLCAGMIVETEAYSGENDKACHAHLNRRTKRTAIMYEEGGAIYTYLCYGIHILFNIVTNVKDRADAVLVRAVEPKIGLEIMKARRNRNQLNSRLTAGPGMMSQALGIGKEHYGLSLWGDQIWIEDKEISISEDQIIASPRVGIDYAEEDALLPWRFRIRDNPWTSPAK